MGTTLRVGFAMGGGVSLGTFSGAALSQALKLLLLRGVDRTGAPYERVVVDVFSGASAGSMSLAIMLRGLVYPDPERIPGATARLSAELGSEFAALPGARRGPLIAAQVLQDVQEEIWVREISLERLLARETIGGPAGSREEAQARLHFTAGIVDRGAVETLARRYFTFPQQGEVGGARAPGSGSGGGGAPAIDLSHRQLLADRVLFASSLANLTPIVADARGELPVGEMGLLGLSDGMTSSVHRELRVFDLHFSDLFAQGMTPAELEDADRFPRRWLRYHAGAKLPHHSGTGRGIGSLLEPKGWARMAATSVASGAFPMAFEPVPLERMAFEFGDTEEQGSSLWPQRLRKAGRDRHVFTYVDGGTFNNEPIREAFRLAAYMDAQDPEGDFERLVVFVDPHFVVPDPSLAVPHHGRWLLDNPNRLLGGLDGWDLKRKSSLDRLIPFAASLVGAVMNESRVVEADKVFRTRKRFALRNQIRRQLDAALAVDPDPAILLDMATHLEELLASDRAGVMIPAGALTLDGELRRVLAEEAGPGSDGAPGLLSSLAGKTPSQVLAVAEDPSAAPAGERGLWLRALTYVAVDRIMDLEGKMERSQLVAISPATDPTDPTALEPLPGRLMGGFGGFASERAGEHEVKVARYCAQLFLEGSGRIETGPLPPKPVFGEDQWREYLEELKAGMGDMEDRLAHLLSASHVDILGALPAALLRMGIKGKLAALAREARATTTYEMRLEVPAKDFEFDGEGIGDQDLGPVKIGGKWFLITFATHTAGEPKPWSGRHVVASREGLKVDRDRKAILPDKKFCTVALPTKPMREAATLLPYPVFVARIKLTDEGAHVGSDRWELLDEVAGLEGAILG